VRKNLAIIALLFAWLCAHGAVWNVVQVVAWSRMFAGYAQSLPIATALRETFDPQKPCELCVVVQQARETDPTSKPADPLRSAPERLILACDVAVAATAVTTTPDQKWPFTVDAYAETRREPVPLPPPRV